MRAVCTTDNRPNSPTRVAAPVAGSPRKRGAKKMNAENYASVEVKRKTAVEENRYEMAERGEKRVTKTRDFEKPDKPDHAGEKPVHAADSLTSLPPADIRNVALLMVLCRSP
jgi:hypothetical protein